MNEYIIKNKNTKKGSAALSWAIVIVLSIALMGITFPRLEKAVTDTGEPIAHEIGSVMDTSGDAPIIKHESVD